MGWSQDELEMVLAAIEGATPGASGWYRVPCPFCERDGEMSTKKKLSVSAETGYFICFRATCGAKGFVNTSEKFLARKPAKPKAAETDGRVPLPEEFVSLASSDRSTSIALRPYINYLYSRGITDAIIEEARLGCCLKGKYATMVVVPVTHCREVAGFTSRSIASKFYSNPPDFHRTRYMLNGDALQDDTTEPIVIVEGPFDALRHWPYAVACFGKPTHHHIKQIQASKRPVVFALDADAQMEGWGHALTFEVSGRDARFLQLRPGTDPGKTTHEEFMEWALSAPRASAINPDMCRRV